MRTKYGVIEILFLCSVFGTLGSCTSLRNNSTIKITSTNIIISTTNTPSTTMQPTNTSTVNSPINIEEPNTPTYTLTKILLTNTPITIWNNIPIMKGAFNIFDNGVSISFQIKSTVPNVYEYYYGVMKSLGYSVLVKSLGGERNTTMYSMGDEEIIIDIAPDIYEEGVVDVMMS
jgi:hypothetical protein